MKTIITIEGKVYRSMPNFVKDDVGITIGFEIKTNNDAVVDLTGYSVSIKVKLVDSEVNQFNRAVTLDDVDSGACSYTLQNGNLDTVGLFEAELELNDNDGLISTIKLGRFVVLEDLPN